MGAHAHRSSSRARARAPSARRRREPAPASGSSRRSCPSAAAGESLEAVVRYGAAPIGGPLEEGVVDNDDFAVPGEVQVKLDGIDAQRRRLAKAAETVLSPQVAASTMADDADHDA